MTTKNMIMLLVLVMSIILAIGMVNAHEKKSGVSLIHEKTERETSLHEIQDNIGLTQEKSERETLSSEKKDRMGSTSLEKTERETLSHEKQDSLGLTSEKTERETLSHETQDNMGLAHAKTQSERLTYEKQHNVGTTHEKTYTVRLRHEKTSDDKFAHEKQDNVELTHEKTYNVTSSTHEKTDSLRLATRDAISLAIREISTTKKFINAIPRLHTIEPSSTTMHEESMALVSCVVGLIECLGEGQGKLRRMRHLNQATLPFIDSDVEALKSTVLSRITSFDNVCRIGLKNVDKTVALMLNRKLEDVKLLATNVIKHVSDVRLNN